MTDCNVVRTFGRDFRKQIKNETKDLTFNFLNSFKLDRMPFKREGKKYEI